MQALAVRQLGDPISRSRYYLDGRRVSRFDWDRAHFGRFIECVGSRMETRRDGSAIVREFHCIRVRK